MAGSEGHQLAEALAATEAALAAAQEEAAAAAQQKKDMVALAKVRARAMCVLLRACCVHCCLLPSQAPESVGAADTSMPPPLLYSTLTARADRLRRLHCA